MMEAAFANARAIEADLGWFERVLAMRLQSYFGMPGDAGAAPSALDIYELEPPQLQEDAYYARFVAHYQLSFAERLVLILALIPHVRPQLLDVLFQRDESSGRGFCQFGGWQGSAHGGLLPTGETAVFILAGDDLALRFELLKLFGGDHFFAAHNILSLAPAPSSEEPLLSGALLLAPEFLYWFTAGVERKPDFSREFPARLIETQQEWSDLILPQTTRDQLEEIRQWIVHRDVLLDDWGFAKKLKSGFVSLFYGPPGTGKTLSACLLGKYCGCDVYKIDLSMIVSKYIGETEKNLARVFDLAEHRNWILFFDEADALFGKRTRVDDAHDRYANQEVSFLLQRIENFSGVVILASNLKANIDDAFLRRFHSVVYFPLPRPPERLQIWRSAFSSKTQLETAIDLQQTADKYDLAGGTIMNVVRYSSLKALSRNTDTILLADIEEGIRREFQKEGRNV